MRAKAGKPKAAIKIAAAALGGLLLAAAVTAVCTRPPELGETPPAEQVAQNPDTPGPIISTSYTQMTPEQVREVTGEYLAVNVWVQNAHDTAEDTPEHFHQMLFTKPSRECVEQHRERGQMVPDPEPEKLLACGMESTERNRSKEWERLSPDEKEARVRRAVGLLFWGLDPPSLMSVMLAQRRGLEVNFQNNPGFARFAARYDRCEEEAGRLGDEMVKTESPDRMAETWLEGEKRLMACASSVTANIFWREERTRDDDAD